MRVELARDHQEFTVRRHIDPVRALWLRDQIHQAFGNGHIHSDDVEPVELLRLAFGNNLSRALIIDDVEIIHVTLGGADLHRRIAIEHAAGGHFRVERIPERPAGTGAFAGIREIVRIRRRFDPERLLRDDSSGLPIELPKHDKTAILFLVFTQRSVFPTERRRVLIRFEDVLRIRGHERATVLADQQWIFDDLLCVEVLEIDDRQPAVRLLVDERKLPVINAVSFAQCHVVGIAVRDGLSVDVATGEHRFCLVTESVTLPWFRSEDSDRSVDAHRGDADNEHLARVPTG